ncbi:hypothetical protein [Paenibacillus sp. 1-18]|uniref:hypothetical protein n=1 Tax=Paenibacillus sp. 1-18 TaxID=1333846 RepID=UPI000472E46F|nr:hypothetical protein [Paenibacillus sp. 1-18]
MRVEKIIYPTPLSQIADIEDDYSSTRSYCKVIVQRKILSKPLKIMLKKTLFGLNYYLQLVLIERS